LIWGNLFNLLSRIKFRYPLAHNLCPEKT
jgi:hypothetical protein